MGLGTSKGAEDGEEAIVRCCGKLCASVGQDGNNVLSLNSEQEEKEPKPME